MNENKNNDGDSPGMEKRTTPTCDLHHDEIRLFCTDCQDFLCIECMLDKHQKHSIIKLSEALETVKQNVEQWCSDKTILSNIKANNEKVQNMMGTNKEAQLAAESDLRKRENSLKEKITEEADQLSLKLKEAFEKYTTKLQRSSDVITVCTQILEKSDLESISNADLIQMYYSLRKCTNEDFQSEINALKEPTLCLNTNSDVFIGCIDPDPNDDELAQVAQVAHEEKEDTESRIAYPIRMETIHKDHFINEVTKIVAIGHEELWIKSNQSLFYVKGGCLKDYSRIRVDDFACAGQDSVFIINTQFPRIQQFSLTIPVTLFTCTDPYVPKCMTYVDKDSSLVVFLGDKCIVTFGLDGIKKLHIDLTVTMKAECIEVFSCSQSSVVQRVNYEHNVHSSSITSLNGNPPKMVNFNGMYGFRPELKFICKGICYDGDGNLIVSDYTFNTIYRLDKDLKLQKVLIDKQAGLNMPTAVALKNGLLYVADHHRISIYRYSDLV